MKKFIILLGLLPLTLLAKLPERYYQDKFALEINGETEVVTGDGTRCDILTETHAIEVDFARKWGEAIGQSLNYSFQLNRRAGILLILESPSDRRHLIRVNSIIQNFNLPIDVWEISAEDMPTETPAPTTIETSESPVSGTYWISSTGTTHVAGCRYFEKGKGQASDTPTEKRCKLCSQPTN